MSVSDYGAVVHAIEQSVRRNLTDGLLLSGGLDTAILAYVAARWSRQYCVTVALKGAHAPDVEYARLVASQLQLEHHVHYFGDEEVEEGIRAVTRIMKTFATDSGQVRYKYLTSLHAFTKLLY